MPKQSVKTAKAKSMHDDFELPAQIDFKKTKLIGFGLEALDHHIASKTSARTVTIAGDVAKDFATDEEINEALRLVQKMRLIGKSASRKKSA